MDSRPFVHAGHELFVTASIGVALFPIDAQEADGLLRCAATAMHRAKESGRNAYCAYAVEMAASPDDRLSMEVDLRRAVERDELYLEYQPRVGLNDFRVVGCEALLRWNCVRRGLVSPARFIPLAEETGLIVPIGRWVIDRALRQAQQWRVEFASLMRVGVNVSGIQLRPSHAESLFSRLVGLELPDYRAIELELTESVLMDEPERINATLSRARELGIEIAIDDFGTGYSSLSYLKSFPIDRLKIDASFVRDVEHDPSDAAIARAVIAIGHALGLKVVAEGVETPGQLAFLLAEGCDEAQGFLFSRPLSAADMAMVLANERPLWKTGDD
jgi:EAL domain-containing protein (putative c-di-GMP-specific phosphodiesterase class I)